ncbi:unnamed protein product, partial [marine sediment metagenome]
MGLVKEWRNKSLKVIFTGIISAPLVLSVFVSLAVVTLTPSIIVLLILSQAVKILREYERGVIFRLGRLVGAKGPGLILLIPIVDRMVRMSLRIITMDVPAQEVITKDTVPVKVNAVIYFRVVNPENAVVEVQHFVNATSQIAQTTLRSVLGQMELDELLSQREKINQ